MHVPQVQVVEKTSEVPQLQTIEEIVDTPENQTVQSTESLDTAPDLEMAPVERTLRIPLADCEGLIEELSKAMEEGFSAVLDEFIENFDKPEGLSAVIDEHFEKIDKPDKKHESDEYVCGTWASEKGEVEYIASVAAGYARPTPNEEKCCISMMRLEEESCAALAIQRGWRYAYSVHPRIGWRYYPSTNSSSSSQWQQNNEWRSTQSRDYWRSSTWTEQ